MTKEEWLRSFALAYRVNTGHPKEAADFVASVCFDLMGLDANPSAAANFAVQPMPDFIGQGPSVFGRVTGGKGRNDQT
jgi:hypothetical protein